MSYLSALSFDHKPFYEVGWSTVPTFAKAWTDRMTERCWLYRAVMGQARELTDYLTYRNTRRDLSLLISSLVANTQLTVT